MTANTILNQVKLFCLVTKVGGDVFIETLTTLYSGEKPIEENLLKVLETNSNGFNFDEGKFLMNLKEGERKIKDLDISLCFKLIQLMCGLYPIESSFNNPCVWSDRCDKEKQDCLEHLLYKYKTKGNELAQQFSSFEFISDKELIRRKEENIELLSAIIEKVGEKANLSNDEKTSWLNKFEFDSRTFGEQAAFINSPNFPGNMSRSESKPSSTNESCLDSGQTSSSRLELSSNSGPIPTEEGCTSSKAKLLCLGVGHGAKKHDPKNRAPDIFPNNDVSLALKEFLLKAFVGTDVDQILAKPLEKSNRLYWVNRLVNTQALDNAEENSRFWKEYEEYLED